MKILYLADGNSIHTHKWINGLLLKGYDVFLFSLNSFNTDDFVESKHFQHETMALNVMKSRFGGLNKIKYLKAIPMIKSIIKKYDPDIVHAHFASSYGLLGVLSNSTPLIISVWGYDVFNFPNRSWINRRLLKRNFRKSDHLLSTSHVMAKETQKFTNKSIEVTPFGIDIHDFSPRSKPRESFGLYGHEDFVIGTAKPLEDKYAIDDLIKAFSILRKRHPEKPLKLALAGKGSAKNELMKLSRELGVSNEVIFLGKIDHTKIPDFLNSLDIFAALSLEESFGVSVIEAGACAKPVVVSNVGGLPEVVDKNITGFIVPKRDPQAAANSLERLLLDDKLREKMGAEGRKKVASIYDWNNCIEQMISIYNKIADKD